MKSERKVIKLTHTPYSHKSCVYDVNWPNMRKKYIARFYLSAMCLDWLVGGLPWWGVLHLAGGNPKDDLLSTNCLKKDY